MRRLLKLQALLALGGGLLATGALPAQERAGGQTRDRDTTRHGAMHQGMMGMMSTMGDCPMMSAMMQGPDAALRQRRELGLTDAQVVRLEALRTSRQEAAAQAMERMAALHKELRALIGGEQFDEPAARGVFDRMAALHTQRGLAMLRTRQEVGAVLTPDQRKTLSERAGDMKGLMGTEHLMGQGMSSMMGMMSCPMMMPPPTKNGASDRSAASQRKGGQAPAAPARPDHHGHTPPASS